MVIAKKSVHVSQLVPNIGQLPGVPANPRTIRDHKFQKLCKSIQDDPEMLEIRELVAIEFNGKYVVVGGNMRLEAIKELGIETATVKILDPATDPEKIKAFIIKDNVSYGENDWEMLANEWEQLQLDEWGMDVPFDIDPRELGTDFNLKSGDRTPFQQMTFALSDIQADFIKQALDEVEIKEENKHGNENSNGNALFQIVFEWDAQRR